MGGEKKEVWIVIDKQFKTGPATSALLDMLASGGTILYSENSIYTIKNKITGEIKELELEGKYSIGDLVDFVSFTKKTR